MKLCLKCQHVYEEEDWKCPSCQEQPQKVDEFLAFEPEIMKDYDGFHEDDFQQLAQLETNHFWFCSRNALILWAMKYFPKATNFCEIGCGTGFVLAAIEKNYPQLKISGSDIFTKGIACAAKRLQNAFLFQMDARNMPFKEEFDIIGAFDVIEHITEDEAVLKQMYSAVRPGGGIVISVPQHQFLWSQYDELGGHVRRYSSKELHQKVKAAGFQVIRMTSFVSMLLPLMLLSRFVKKQEIKDYDPKDELKIGKWTNVVLEKVLTIERFFIRLGLNFPMGGSLLLIAKKV